MNYNQLHQEYAHGIDICHFPISIWHLQERKRNQILDVFNHTTLKMFLNKKKQRSHNSKLISLEAKT